MKRLFLLLLLLLSKSVLAMEQGYPEDYVKQDYEDDARTIISKKAAPLHEFLTENLDNTDQVPEEVMIKPIARALKSRNINPSIFLELKDKRGTTYQFASYLNKEKNKNKRLDLGLTKAVFWAQQENKTKNIQIPDNGFDWISLTDAQIQSIKVCDKNDNNVIETFNVIQNAHKKYEEKDNEEYSLLDLLLRCKRPDIVEKLLHESSYHLVADVSGLKSYCDENIEELSEQSDELVVHWKDVKNMLDESIDLQSGIKGIIKLKDGAMLTVPIALFALHMKGKIKKDFYALSKVLREFFSFEPQKVHEPQKVQKLADFLKNIDPNPKSRSSMIIPKELNCEWKIINPMIPGMQMLVCYDDDKKISASTIKEIWWKKYHATEILHYVPYLLNKYIGNFINLKFGIDKKITNMLSHKSVAGIVISGKRSCQNLLENISGIGHSAVKEIMPKNQKDQLEEKKEKPAGQSKKNESSSYCTIV